uniref:intersectin-2-like n=1 Tax=Styela clava TaxID=7725 RepID=UPI0019398A7A|nr:intersectin-2-like [Styela clava]
MAENPKNDVGMLRRRRSEPAVLMQHNLNRLKFHRSSINYPSKIQEEDEVSKNAVQTSYINLQNGKRVEYSGDVKYTPPRTRRLSLDSRFSEPGKKKLTFEQWCKMGHERSKREKMKQESDEQRKFLELTTRRNSITFEEWNKNVEMRKKIEELKIAEKEKEDLETKEAERLNNMKRRISFTEWLGQKTERQSINYDNDNKDATSERRVRRSGLDSINIFDGSNITRQMRRNSETPLPVSVSVDEQEINKLQKSNDAFQKWMVKKELEAIKKEREELLKSRQLFSEYLKQNSSVCFPSLV